MEAYLKEGWKDDQAIKAKLDALSVDGVDLDALAAKGAELLAIRLAE